MQSFITWFRNLDIRTVAYVLGTLTLIEQAVVSGQISFEGLLPLAWIPIIKTTASDFITLNGILLIGQPVSAVKWPTPSTIITKPDGTIAKVVLALAIGAALAFAFPLSAMAQTKTAPAKAVAKVTIAQAQTNPLAVLQQFSIADLQAALADAQANNDVTTIPCWTALLAGVQAQQAAAPALPAGVFSAIQKTRDLKIQAANLLAANGPLANLNIACAPLLMDANATLAAFGIATGVVVGTGGIALPALPGFLPLLLAPK